MNVQPDPVGPGQESVWAYPRPAIAEPCARRIEIRHGGQVIADSRASIRTLETSHPPSYYIPRADILMAALRPSGDSSFCEWKGHAVYFDLVLGDAVLRNIAWSYPDPTPDFVLLRDHLAFYAAPLDGCFVDGERATPQPGAFYGGWVTAQVAGPFKGGPDSRFW
jgi:uncharacterized protein (DUF427 family)